MRRARAGTLDNLFHEAQRLVATGLDHLAQAILFARPEVLRSPAICLGDRIGLHDPCADLILQVWSLPFHRGDGGHRAGSLGLAQLVLIQPLAPRLQRLLRVLDHTGRGRRQTARQPLRIGQAALIIVPAFRVGRRPAGRPEKPDRRAGRIVYRTGLHQRLAGCLFRAAQLAIHEFQLRLEIGPILLAFGRKGLERSGTRAIPLANADAVGAVAAVARIDGIRPKPTLAGKVARQGDGRRLRPAPLAKERDNGGFALIHLAAARHFLLQPGHHPFGALDRHGFDELAQLELLARLLDNAQPSGADLGGIDSQGSQFTK